MKNNHETNNDDATIQNIPGPPVPSYHNSSWKLISQGAEARIWLVPNFIQYGTIIGSTISSTSGGVQGINDKSPNIIPTTNSNDNHVNTIGNMRVTSTVICKERFPKTYRHPILDETLTKSRTKAEAKNLTRCRRGGVSVPLILGVDLNTTGNKAVDKCVAKNDHESHDAKDKGTTNTTTNSACLFMEYISGCTVRSFLNVPIPQSQQQQQQKWQQDQNEEEEEEPCAKKQRLSELETKSIKYVTRLDEYATKVAYQIGVIVAKMHNVNIVHGDLTTSNMILRNSSSVPINIVDDAATTTSSNSQEEWTPDIVLIDFGLSSTSMNTKKTSSHEERAVDLYVLERSFVTTHVGSEELVKEIMRGYKATCQSGDSVFVRLAQVRLRGRKRECFG